MRIIINILSWILGGLFSALLFIGLLYMIRSSAEWGLNFGEEIAYSLMAEHEIYDIHFVLEQDTSIADVAQMLEDQGIIEDARFYRFEMWLMGHTEYYEEGTFTLNRNLSATQINNRLRAQPVVVLEEDQFMIPEGWTQRDMATYFESRGWFTAEEFMHVANTHDFGFGFLREIPHRPRTGGQVSRLEGYLFPDTYRVFENPTPEQVIMTMLNRFNQVFNFEYRMRAEELGMTIDEVVIKASMIEREVVVPEERAMVSRVMLNRMEQGMRLQIDATVIYALDRRLDRVLYEHLEYPSPFNTYFVHGLPLGPIANPGAASIHAALFPADGNWLFYVLSPCGTGAHNFASTYAQHLIYRQQMPRPWEN